MTSGFDRLSVKPGLPPMEAKLVDALPSGPGWQYEPKWDGFRCLIFKAGDEIELQSKSGKPLARYFPEVVAAVASLKADSVVLDGELIIPIGDHLSFDALQMRLHPAESRIRRLSSESPAQLMLFYCLVGDDGESLLDRPLVQRRSALERLYAIFRVPRFGAPRIRAVKKEQKHYHVDWSLVPADAARFENLVAGHLLKWVHFQQDTLGRDVELRYFRDTDGREVDFVVVERRSPLLLVECKWGDTDVDRSLRYLKARFPDTDAWQVSATGTKDFVSPDGIRVAPALRLLTGLI